MAVNTRKTSPKTAQKLKSNRRNNTVFGLIEKYVRVRIFEQGLPVKYIPYILYITFLGIIYIANRNFAEKNTAKLAKLKTRIDDIRTDYITQSAEYMTGSKQSEVAKKVKDRGLGLEESKIPPYKIEVK